MLEAVIFDLDGTLIDSAPDLTSAANHVLESEGLAPVSDAAVRAMVGHGGRVLIRRGLAHHGISVEDDKLEALYARFLAYYGANIAIRSRPFPGVVDVLEKLVQRGIKIGICTNKPTGLSASLVESLGLAQYFGAIVGPDTLGIAKPDPAPYRESLRQLGVLGPSLMVGDSETDVLTARNSQVPVIGVTFGYTPRPIGEFSPDYIINDYQQIWPILAERYHW